MDKISELRKIINNTPHSGYNAAVCEKKDFFYLEHLSNIRKNTFSWIPFKKSDGVLEVGSSYGAVTELFWDKAGHTDCLVDNFNEKQILEDRLKKNCPDADLSSIHCQSICDYAKESSLKYDYVIFSKTAFKDSNDLKKKLSCVAGLLKDDGQIIFALDNKYALRQLAGCRDENTRDFFSGIEGYLSYNGAKNLSKEEIDVAVSTMDDFTVDYYYPYPDYKYAFQIFSDDRLPIAGELTSNLLNFDENRLLLFDETAAFDQIIKDNRFPDFANSYLVRLRKKDIQKDEKMIYVKYSNDRSEEYQIRTEIRNTAGEKKVFKLAESEAAKKHLDKMLSNYAAFEKIAEGSSFRLNRTRPVKDGIELEYLTGISLEEKLDQYLYSGRIEEFKALFHSYINEIKNLATKDFSVTDNFEKVFGKCPEDPEFKSLGLSDIDLIFKNIIIKDNIWSVLDYEWSYDFPVPVDFIIYRAVHYYQELGRQSALNKYFDLYEEAGISEEQKKLFFSFEMHFQKYINENCISLRDIYEMTAPPLIPVITDVEREPSEAGKRMTTVKKIYDDGHEAIEKFYPVSDFDGVSKYGMDVEENLKAVKIRFAKRPCQLEILQALTISGNDFSRVEFTTEGTEIYKNVFIYTGDKAEIEIDNLPETGKSIYFEWFTSFLGKRILEDKLREAGKN